MLYWRQVVNETPMYDDTLGKVVNKMIRPASRFFSVALIISLLFSPVVSVFAQESDTPPAPEVAEPTNQPEEITPVDTSPIDSALQDTSSSEQTDAQEGKGTDQETKGSYEEDSLQADTEVKEDPDNPPLALLSGSGATNDHAEAERQSAGRLNIESDPMGALVTSFPITLPPGRGDLTPDLKLLYSSQRNTNGPFGYSWDSNIPYIEHINKDGVDLMNGERYFLSSLDGELASSTLASTTFYAKIDNGDFVKYLYNASSTYWTATYKNGTIYTYGNSTSTRQSSSTDETIIHKWMLQEIRDTNNNYIKYEYYSNGGQIYPYKITYTGNDVTDGPFTVTFLRESRTDTQSLYKDGFGVTSSYRVNEIDVAINGTWKRKYEIGYGYGVTGGRSLIKSITESGQDDLSNVTTLSPNYFGYSSSTKTYAAKSSDFAFGSPTIEGRTFIDVNGDGYPDLINTPPGSGMTVWINHRTSYDIDYGWTVPGPLNQISNPDPYRIGDVNGDGLPDFLYSQQGSATAVYLNTGSNWVLNSAWSTQIPVDFVWISGGSTPHDAGIILSDLNGDGLIDISHGADGPTSPQAFLNTGTGWRGMGTARYYDNNSFASQPVTYVDVNGDGLADRIYTPSSPKTVQINNGYTFAVDTNWTVPGPINDPSNDQGYRLADINGDGLIDIVYGNTADTPHCKAYINNGSNWIEDTGSCPPVDFIFTDGGGHVVSSGAVMIDINGDGVSDAIGGGFWESAFSRLNNGPIVDLLTNATSSAGVVTSITYRASTQYLDGGNNPENPLLPQQFPTVYQKKVTDGISPTQRIGYDYQGGRYFYGGPFNRRFAGFNVVQATTSAGQIVTTSFHVASSTDSAHGAYSDDEWKIGKPYSIEKFDGSSNPYSKTLNKWVDTDLSNGRRFVNLAQSVQFDYDGNSSHRDTAIKNTFESTYGNLQQTINYGEVTGSDDGTFSDTGSDIASTTIGYAASTTLYIVGLPATELTQNQSSVKLRETNHYYDSLSSGNVSKGNETKTENWATTTTYASTTRTFNSTYGLVTASRDPLSNLTTYVIDSFNLYPATTTNALSQDTGYTYDYATGKVKNIFDANSRLYTTTYDALRRPLVVSIPDPSSGSLVTKTAYIYTDSATPGSTIIQQTDYLNSATSSNTYTYFDGFGRKLQERKPADGINTFAVVDYAYNNLGLIASTSLPYFSSSTARTTATTSAKMYTQLTYDPLQRVTQIVNAVGTTTSTYDDWRTRTTDANGKNKDFWKDAYGNLANVVEYLSGSPATTTYAYDTVNNLTKITDALSNLRNFIYDGLARRIWSEDLHASGDTLFGTSTYTYDVASNLTSTKDPNNRTTNYTFDALNRKLTEDYTGQGGTEITYVYDTCLNGKGKLCSATTTNNGIILSTGRVYNPLGLASTETKYVNGQWYNTSYTFDRQANQSKITYPDNSEVRYTYATSSKPIRIEQRETSGSSWRNIVANVTYSPMGQEASIYWGSQATTTYTYDQNALYRLTNILTLAPTAGTGGNALAMAMAGKGWASSFALAPSLQKLSLAKADQLSELVAPAEPSLTEELFGDAILFAKPHTSAGTPDLNAKPHIEEISDERDFSVAFASQIKNVGAEGIVIQKDKPKVRLKKWNDEVNVGISYDGVATTGVKVANADKVEWKENAQSVEVYPLDPKEGMEDGGLEMEVVLNTIPTSNVFNFAVDGADDLDFFYQSPMNELDHSNDSRIASCTEDACTDKEGNVVESYLPGVLKSYAVYHKTKRNYELGGLNYATGKVFQIFRPKAVDADGNETWAELSYASGTLSVTVPQGFLKKATYPVRVDPTFGYTTAGGTQENWSANDLVGYVNASGSNYTLPVNAIVSKLTISVKVASGSTNLKGLFYAHGTPPGSKQSTTTNPTTVSNTTQQWVDLTFSPSINLSAAAYALAHIGNGSWTSYRDNTAGQAIRYFQNGSSYTTLPDPFPSGATSGTDRIGSIYATYVPNVSQTLQNMSYTYDAMGNITTITDYSDTGAGKIANFTYDDLNRLLAASTTQASSTSYRYQYAYDLLGSITGSKLNSSATTSYTYAGILYANPHAPTKIGSTVLGYDNAGNATSSGSTVYAWDWRNRLSTSTVSGTTRIYSYDENDSRARIDDGTTVYHYPNPLYQTDSVSALPTKHILLNGKDIATIEGATGSGTVTFRYPDHLGSTNVATDNTNTVLQTIDYYPYGSRRINSGTDVSQREYIGQFFDEGPGLSYLNARYYNGMQGQFISQDPVFLGTSQNLQDPQSLNSYSYANDSPISKSDPSGKVWWYGFYDWRGYNGVPGVMMKLGEVFGGHERALEAQAQYQGTINAASAANGVSSSLTNAIIYEEQSHLMNLPGLPVESAVDYLLPNSNLGGYDGGVGIMQVSGSVGSKLGGYSKTELARDPKKNILSGTAYLSSISNSVGSTNYSAIGQQYNGSPAYGQRINAQMQNPNYNSNIFVGTVSGALQMLQGAFVATTRAQSSAIQGVISAFSKR